MKGSGFNIQRSGFRIGLSMSGFGAFRVWGFGFRSLGFIGVLGVLGIEGSRDCGLGVEACGVWRLGAAGLELLLGISIVSIGICKGFVLDLMAKP